MLPRSGMELTDRDQIEWVIMVEPDRIASGGESAGGYLAACVQLVDPLNAESDDMKVSARPNAMVLFNPATWAGRRAMSVHSAAGAGSPQSEKSNNSAWQVSLRV